MSYKYDIYLAGPFFNDQQKATMDVALSALRAVGYVVCDPRDLSPVLVDMPPEERKKFTAEIYQKNIKAIDESYIVIACIDDRDTGTAFELGYTIGSMEERDCGFATFSGFGHGCNVMLSEPSLHHWSTTQEMIEGMTVAKKVVDRRPWFTEELSTLWGSERVKAEATE